MAGSTYKTPGTGVGCGVELGKGVTVGIIVAVTVAGTNVGRAVEDPHPATSRERIIKTNSACFIVVSMK
jgi:hypothetical protein